MSQNLDFKALVPSYLRNDTLNGLMDNLFNRFVSQEDSVFVAGNIGVGAADPVITLSSLERQNNALVPGFHYRVGSQSSVFTFNDLIIKLNSLDADLASLRSWSAERSYNFAPPIDYDKFVNYSNYYWVGGHDQNPAPEWNPTRAREYIVIQNPLPTDVNVKLPVRLATTRPIALQPNDRVPETFTITFSSSSTFSIDSDIAPGRVYVANGVGTPSNPISTAPGAETRIVIRSNDGTQIPSLSNTDAQYPDFDVAEIYLTNGQNAFSAGDTITVYLKHFTSSSVITLDSPNLVGKGTATGAATLSGRMYIDGILVRPADRILVKDQLDPSENGIYLVSDFGEWARAYDASELEHFTVGQKIYVSEGFSQKRNVYQVSSVTPSTNFQAITFTLAQTSGSPGINDWQLSLSLIHI